MEGFLRAMAVAAALLVPAGAAWAGLADESKPIDPKAIQASGLFGNATRSSTWHGAVKPIPVTSASYVANFARGRSNEVIWSVGNMAVVLSMSKDTDKSLPAKPTQLKVTVKETGKGSAAISAETPKDGATVNCFAISPDGKTWLCRDIKVQGKQSSDTKPSQDGFEPVKSTEPQQDARQLD